MALTDDAKAAIADAIRIVREDKVWQRLERIEKGTAKPADPTPPTPPTDPTPPGPTPPPPTPPVDTPPNPDKGRKSAYWGILDDED